MAKLRTCECFIYQKLRPLTLQLFFCRFRVNATFSALVIDFFKVIIYPKNNFYFQNIEMCFHLQLFCCMSAGTDPMPGYNQLKEKQNAGIIKAIDVPSYLTRQKLTQELFPPNLPSISLSSKEASPSKTKSVIENFYLGQNFQFMLKL